MHSKDLLSLTEETLDDMKARDVRVMDVRELTSLTDYMVIASGGSDRHVSSIADRIIERTKAAGHAALGVEGKEHGEWVLVDLDDIVVHIMQPRIRDFYKLENLWDMSGGDDTVNVENAY